jgi:hypothetical protein
LIAVQTLTSKYTWHLLDLRYVPNIYYKTIIALKTKNYDVNFARNDEAG